MRIILRGDQRLQRQMAVGEALQPLRRIELGPFRAQAGDGVALLADFRMQPQHALGARGGFHLDAVDIGGGEHQRGDHEEMDDPHGQPPLITSSRTGHAGNAAAACAAASVRSAARSLAERARGLAETSSPPAVTGRLVRMTKLGARLVHFRQMPRAAAGLAAFDQEILDDAVFQRMKRHHHQPAARLQHALGGRQRQMQFVELRVDENPQAPGTSGSPDGFHPASATPPWRRCRPAPWWSRSALPCARRRWPWRRARE